MFRSLHSGMSDSNGNYSKEQPKYQKLTTKEVSSEVLCLLPYFHDIYRDLNFHYVAQMSVWDSNG